MSAIPVETIESDLCVIGGGLAGLCAAVAAARRGRRVVLLQDRPVLGGNCSTEIRVVPHGSSHANVWGQETGLGYELILDQVAHAPTRWGDHGMVGPDWDITLFSLVRATPHLRVLFNAPVREVVSDAEGPQPQPRPAPNGLGSLGGGRRRIRSVLAHQQGSERTFRVAATQFIDATGDGTVGFLAGADWRMGREGRDEFGEALAPVQPDRTTMGSTITMRARDTGAPTAFTAPPWAVRYENPEDFSFDRICYHLGDPIFGGYWWIEISNPFHQLTDNQEIRDRLHAHVLGVWDFIKNRHPERQRVAHHVLDWMGTMPGKRESRRLMGLRIQSERDCHCEYRGPDAFGLYGWWIDLHIPGGIENRLAPGERENQDTYYKHWIRIPAVSFALGQCASVNVANLWMAGRDISVTHVGLGPIRCMQTLGQLGHGVGIAAALAVENGVDPAQALDVAGPLLQPIRQAIIRDDVRVIALRNDDPADLARTARATASSAAVLDLSQPVPGRVFTVGDRPATWPTMGAAIAAVVPVMADRIDHVDLWLINPTAQAITARVALQGVDRPWERDDRPDHGPEVTAEVPAGHDGWVRVALGARVPPGRLWRIVLRGTGLQWVSNGTVRWPGTSTQYLVVSPGGPEPRNAHLPCYQKAEVDLPAYRHWRVLHDAPALRLEPASDAYSAAEAVNGYAWPDHWSNCWISDPGQALPQHLDLDFGQMRSIARVEVSFDTNLARLTQGAGPNHRAPECVRDWRLLARQDGVWHEVFREMGNYQRKRRIDLTPVVANALRLEALATNGDPTVRVYEIRVYEKA